MKKLVGVLIALAVVIYMMFSGGAFKKDFIFNGETYGHVKNVQRGGIINHFYTPRGVDMNSAARFVQILEMNDDIQKSDWTSVLSPLFNTYKLKSFEDNPLECVGRNQKAGFFTKNYSAPITVDGNEHMAIFVRIVKKEDGEDSDSEIFDMITELKNIQFE